MFKKYQHIERWGSDEVENINIGKCYVFPKLDGTNGSLWVENDNIYAGSRNRLLTLDKDNQGFFQEILRNCQKYINFFNENLNYRLYGEWLVPHSLKTYREDAWKKFYVFDVMEGERYLSYDEYKPLLEKHDIDYILCISIIENGSYEQFINQLDKTNFLIEDGKGLGEGIVIKNYNYVNKYGRKTWAKIVRSEFKEAHQKVMGATEMKGRKIIEEEIIENFLTDTMIDKTYEKIKVDGWNSKKIPELLNRVWHDFVIEETWNILKKYKLIKIDFKTLQYFCFKKIKEIKEELF